MEREQIIKALECCSKLAFCGNECPYYEDGDCVRKVTGNALSLIKELTEENERLKEICGMKECVIENAEAVIARTKADTVRKMQAALEQRIHSKLAYQGWYLKETVIPQIAKEMVET